MNLQIICKVLELIENIRGGVGGYLVFSGQEQPDSKYLVHALIMPWREVIFCKRLRNIGIYF